MAKTLKQLRSRIERLKLEKQIELIEGSAERRRHINTMVESAAIQASAQASTAVDRHAALYDNGWFDRHDARVNLASDHYRGDNRPHWMNEYELSEIRGICRFLAQLSEVAIGVRGSRRNFVVGQGMEVDVSPRAGMEENAFAQQTAAEVNAWLAEQLNANNWPGEYEMEAFDQLVEDGEQLWVVEPDRYDESLVRFRLEQPEFLTEPGQPEAVAAELGMESGLDWKYGIAAPYDESWRSLAYHVLPYDAIEARVYDGRYVEHVKSNVRRYVKRGVSDYYPVWQTLNRMEKLLGNTLEGSAVQASIAYIIEHAESMSNSDIAGFVDLQADAEQIRPTQRGSRTLRGRETFPGTVHHTPSGAKYHQGPLGTSHSPIYLDVIAQAMRVVGIRWQMPEYMVSGDASNANYASTLVAESPFVKSCKAQQYAIAKAYERLFRKVIRMGCESGLLRYRFAQLMRLVEIRIEPEDPAARNELENHQLRKSQHEQGLLSLDSWAAAEGIDLEAERAKGAVPRPSPGLQESYFGYP